LAVKSENIKEHSERCDKIKKQLLILKEALNKQELDMSMQQIIKKDIENMESYCRKVDKAEAKLEEHEKELKKEVPIVETFEKIKRLKDNFDVPKLNDDTKVYLEAGKKDDEGEGLKPARCELQICFKTQIDDLIHKVQESATKYAERLKQDMNNLNVNYEQMKDEYADEEAELRKGIAEKCKAQKELRKKNEELLEDNEKLKKKKEQYEDDIKNQISKLNSITAEIEEGLKKLERENNKQELNDVIIQVEAQNHNLYQLKEEYHQKEDVIDELIEKEANIEEEIIESEVNKEDLLQKYNILKIDVENPRELKEDYMKKNIELEKENLELRERMDQLESELEVWKHKCAKENEEHVKLKNKIEALFNQKSDLESKVKDSLETRINEFANYIKEVSEKIETRAKKASEVFTKLRELCKNIILNVDYINNEKSSSQVKIDLDKSDINQIYINLEEIIKRIGNAYLNIKSEKEAEIEVLKEDITECKEILEDRENCIRDKEVEFIELMRHMNPSNQKETSSCEIQGENTGLTENKGEFNKELEDLKNNEVNLVKRCDILHQERSKLKEDIIVLEKSLKDLEKDIKDLEDENIKIRGESEDLNNKILSLEGIKTTLEKDNALLKEVLKNSQQENESLKKQTEEQQSKAKKLEEEVEALKKEKLNSLVASRI